VIIGGPLAKGEMKVIEVAQMVSKQDGVFLKMSEEVLFVSGEYQSI